MTETVENNIIMALLISEHGISVSLNDTSTEAMDDIIKSANDQNINPVPNKA
jgi:hypothetical protein